MFKIVVASLLIGYAGGLQGSDWGKAVRQASQMHRQGDLKRAEAELLKALLLAEAFGGSDPRLAYTLDYLGTLNMQMGEAAKARPMFERALKIFEAARGASAGETLETASRLAECLEASGDLAGAEGLYRRVVEAGREDPMQRSVDLNNLALVLDAQGRQDEALPLYQRALELREKTFGRGSTEAAEILSNLARVFYMKGAYEQAEKMFLEALAIDEKKLGKRHPQVADDCLRLAPLYRKTGRRAEAEKLEARAAAILAGKP